MKKRNTGKKIAKYVVIAIILFVLLFPVYWMINCSLLPSNVIMSVPPRFFPINATLKNFSQIFTRASYLRFFQNSFIVSFGTIAIVLLVAVPASYALSRYNFFGRRVILSSVSSVQMFPVVVILTTLYGFYNSWRMLDTYRGLILADTTFALPLAITLMKSFFDTLSKSLGEAARIDGASRMRVLLHILLPLVVPGLVAVGIYTFLNAWDDYLMALTIMKSNEMRTLPVGIAQSFLGEYSNDYGGLMAFAVAGSLPIVLLFIFFQKYLVSGMTAGAVKG